jgi:hypothetical protein
MRGKLFARILILGVATTLLVASVLWWKDSANALRPPEYGERTHSVSSTSRLEESEASQIAASSLESRLGEVTPEEKKQIESRLTDAKGLLHQIELSKAGPAVAMEDKRFRSDTVQVPALTVGDLQPVYDALSRAANEFELRSAAREAFRRRADAFLTKLRSRPSKVVMRVIDRQAGNTTYKVVSFSERTKATLMEAGGVRVDGPNTIRIVGPGEESEAAEFFSQLPKSAAPGGLSAESEMPQ